MKISKKSVEKPLVVGLFTLFIVIIGLMGASLIPIELFPEVEIPVVIVSVPYIGAAPNELENEVIRKLEEKIRKIDNVKKIQSWAVNSSATVVVEFYEGVDLDIAKTDVRNAVNDAQPEMPTDIETPIISTVDFDSVPIMTVAIYGKIKNYKKLREIAEDMQTPLEGVNGVGSVSIFGGHEQQINIDLNPVKMHAYKLSVDYIVNYLKQSNLNFPGGSFKSKGNEYPMRIIGRFKTVNQLKESIITFRKDSNNPMSTPKPVRLNQVAQVKDGIKDVDTISRFNNVPCVSLEIRKKPKENILQLSKRIQRELKRIQEQMLTPIGLKYVITGDQADSVQMRVDDLFNSIWQGVLAIFIVLWIGMGFRNAFIASLGIPFCIVFTMGALFLMGRSLNNLSQFGLIIVIGMVVDGAIVTLENIYRHREKGKSKKESTIVGMGEVGTSVLSSVLTTMGAFAPLLFMTGVTGQFMSNIPVAVLLALTASIIFDHIVIPVLALKFMSDPSIKAKMRAKKAEKKKRKNGGVEQTDKKSKFELIFNFYKKIIRKSVNNRGWTMLITVIVFIIGVAIFATREQEMFSPIDLGKVYIKVNLPPIASLKQTDKIVKGIEKNLLIKYKNNGIIKQWISTVGSASDGGSTTSVIRQSNKSVAMISIEMVDYEKRKGYSATWLQGKIRNYVSKIPGAKFQVEKPKGGPPTGAPVNVVIQGENIQILKRLSRNIQQKIRDIPGAVDIRDNYGVGVPEIKATVRRRMADLHGISVQQIARALSVTFNGLDVTKYYVGDKEVDVKVKIADKYAKNLQDLRRIYFFKTQTGSMIHLTELVDIKMSSGLSVIARQEMKRAITISGDTFGRSSVEVMKDVKAMLKNYPMPTGYKILYKGENEERDESFKSLGLAFIGGLILIYIIITLQLSSFIQPVSILATILLSVVGISFGLLMSASKVGIMSLFGAVALMGIVVNDAIVLVSYINLLRSRGMDKKEAIILACETRIRPIFMTTFTTIAGLLPLALALGGPRTVFWVPMAWVIIGGLLFATLQTLVVVPIIYSLLEDTSNKMCTMGKKFIGFIKSIIKKIFKIEFPSDYADDEDKQKSSCEHKFPSPPALNKDDDSQEYKYEEI